MAAMTNRDTQPTDEQMNELVFADVNDPSAWGDPIAVRASKGPRRIRHANASVAKKEIVVRGSLPHPPRSGFRR